ncbi:LmbU family transcriptional regulator [Streptomyces sp. NPDC048507]|uniref:LmbU family transcriptional regulator n=1 Tax=Streptomyces sp. NPDC048507 TaxID=3365560 RepID=UPI00371DB622
MRTASGFKAGPGGDTGEPAQRDLVLPFAGSRAKVRTSGMVLPQNLPERSWEQIGTDLRELVNSSAWWLADWLIYGEATYGWRRYKEAIERTGLDYQTLRNYAWVARRFEHHRRRDALSFAHHAEVARLAPPEQDYWLRKAEQQKWSRNELRRSVRASLAVQSDTAEAAPAGGDGQRDVPRPAAATRAGERRQEVTTLTIELSAGQLEHLSKTAAAHGLPVDKWVARMLAGADRHSATA